MEEYDNNHPDIPRIQVFFALCFAPAYLGPSTMLIAVPDILQVGSFSRAVEPADWGGQTFGPQPPPNNNFNDM